MLADQEGQSTYKRLCQGDQQHLPGPEQHNLSDCPVP
jgi:hypothetical protein